MSRGFFAIGVYNPKTEANVGSLLRAASLYDAAFVFTVGSRYKKQASDTSNTPRHTPLFEFDTIDDLIKHLPRSTPLVAVELDPAAVMLDNFYHPERACYLLGAEDNGLPPMVLKKAHQILQIESPNEASMNVACAGSIILYNRHITRKK